MHVARLRGFIRPKVNGLFSTITDWFRAQNTCISDV